VKKMSNKIPKGTQKPQANRPRPPNIRKQGPPPQGVPLSPRPRLQINPSNARGKNANFAQSDLRKQRNNVNKAIVATIMALRKENAELKAKLAKAGKKP
jgi:hypothetical protein